MRFPWLLVRLKADKRDKYFKMVSTRSRPVVMLDVTHMSQTGLRTGIQRVVRSIYQELQQLLPDGTDIEPVILSSKGSIWHFRYYDLETGRESTEIAVPRNNDKFLGIDLNTELVYPIHAGLFEDWSARGARMVFTVHDILPVTHSHWFPHGVHYKHELWLHSVVSAADVLLSVSKATQDEVLSWAGRKEVDTSHLQFEWFHLGADFGDEDWGKEGADTDEELLARMFAKPTFLLVGTLEKRKGHLQCLLAFELLWRKGLDVQLVFVGCQGWMVDELMEKIRLHPELDKRFFWLDGVSDGYLAEIYAASSCLIQPSSGEGFGLPLIEGAQFGLPIIARDIPVFRELAANHAHYFCGEDASDLSAAVEDWLLQYEKQEHITSDGLEWSTWHEAAVRIKTIMYSSSEVQQST